MNMGVRTQEDYARRNIGRRARYAMEIAERNLRLIDDHMAGMNIGALSGKYSIPYRNAAQIAFRHRYETLGPQCVRRPYRTSQRVIMDAIEFLSLHGEFGIAANKVAMVTKISTRGVQDAIKEFVRIGALEVIDGGLANVPAVFKVVDPGLVSDKLNTRRTVEREAYLRAHYPDDDKADVLAAINGMDGEPLTPRMLVDWATDMKIVHSDAWWRRVHQARSETALKNLSANPPMARKKRVLPVSWVHAAPKPKPPVAKGITDPDEFIRLHGVTRCPTVALMPTQATIPDADKEALIAHYARLEYEAANDPRTIQRIARRTRGSVAARAMKATGITTGSGIRAAE